MVESIAPPAHLPPEEPEREIANLLPNNQRQCSTCYALCHILYHVSAAHMSIFWMDSDFTSYLPLSSGHMHFYFKGGNRKKMDFLDI